MCRVATRRSCKACTSPPPNLKNTVQTPPPLQAPIARDAYPCPRCGGGANRSAALRAPLTNNPSTAPLVNLETLHSLVLIADDDSLVRGSLAAVLEFEGFEVDEAEDGIEAVSHAVQNFPDLILLDLNMPKLDGWNAFAKLDRVKPLVPVIVITARPNQYHEAVRLGVDAFMEKPLNIPILVRAIKHLTSEDESRHIRRISDPAFITRLLDNDGS